VPDKDRGPDHFFRRRWLIPLILCLITGIGLLLLIEIDPVSTYDLAAARLAPRTFGALLFRHYWYAVELVSLLLFVGLAGALYLGRPSKKINVEP
jgi:NADH:ubiquinone oxidoreductase subunit 6 (subunit J)